MRAALVRLHRWTGLLMALFLIAVSVTGAVLPFATAIERVLVPRTFAPPHTGAVPLDLAALALRAEAQEPRARVAYFSLTDPDRVLINMQPRLNPATGRPYGLDFDQIFLDPITGQELGRRLNGDISQGLINLMPFILTLHTSLALGDAGTLVLGIVALGWTVDCFVSLILALPLAGRMLRRRWLAVLGVKTGASTFRATYDLHRAGGVWLWPILLVFAWSSVMFNLAPVYTAVTAATLGYSPVPPAVATLHANETPKLGWRAAQACGQKLMAAAAARRGVRIIRPFGMAYIDIYGVYDYDARTSADVGGDTWESGVWLDGNSCTLRDVSTPEGRHAGDWVSTWLYALHFADFHNWLIYRIFVALVGGVVVMLSATGLILWWKKRAAAAWRRRR